MYLYIEVLKYTKSTNRPNYSKVGPIPDTFSTFSKCPIMAFTFHNNLAHSISLVASAALLS